MATIKLRCTTCWILEKTIENMTKITERKSIAG